jgi:Ran GTPase-activating protein (RanGAP) involved in mRNA processing and transport
MEKSDSENDLDFHLAQPSVKRKPAGLKKTRGLRAAVSRVQAENSLSTKLREIDHEQQRFVGQNAVANSMHKYLASGRLAQIAELQGKPSGNPLVHYYQAIEKAGTIPRGMGFVNKQKNINELNVENQFMGSQYVDALSKGVAFARYVTDLKLKDTGLETAGAIKIVKGMASRIKSLDISYNPSIGLEFYQVLGEILQDPKASLEVLNLEGNRMGDKALEVVCEALSYSRTIKVLNLSKNEITDKGVPHVCKVLEHCGSLEGLFLHSNRIMGPGGLKIAEQLQGNKNVEILDISFNAIGGGKTTGDVEELVRFRDLCARSWARCFQENKSLIHVDISHNNLRSPQMEIIAAGLAHNHTILGIHSRGNDGEVDAQGFIQLG